MKRSLSSERKLVKGISRSRYELSLFQDDISNEYIVQFSHSDFKPKEFSFKDYRLADGAFEDLYLQLEGN